MDFILSPLTMYGVLAASTTLLLFLLLSLAVRSKGRLRQHSAAVDDIRREISELREQVQKTVSKVTAPADRLTEASGAPGPTVAMNLTRRAQVLRLYRMGSDPVEIARRLSLQLGEVELVVKIHNMLVEQSART